MIWLADQKQDQRFNGTAGIHLAEMTQVQGSSQMEPDDFRNNCDREKAVCKRQIRGAPLAEKVSCRHLR